MSRLCQACGVERDRDAFSKNQWTGSPAARRCKACIDAGRTPAYVNKAPRAKGDTRAPASSGSGGRGGRGGEGGGLVSQVPDMSSRPQRMVPGFEHLTVAADWPQTKKGQPPSAQSAIFNPLLACVLGPIEGFYSEDELSIAQAWWSNVMPAWPRWVDELRVAGVPGQLEHLMRNVKGQPNPLIYKHKGWGSTNLNPSVPHFGGRAQNTVLEMAPMVEVELFACVTVLYSAEYNFLM